MGHLAASPRKTAFRTVATGVFLLAGMTLGGCATTRTAVGLRPLPPGAPSPSAILRDLAENQDRLAKFDAKIEFLLESPQVTGKNTGVGRLYYERPSHLFARAVHWPTGVPVLELTVSGPEYLLWLPQDNQAYHSVEGIEFESVPFRVSPGNIVQEMFHPEDWSGLVRNEVYVEAHDETTQTTTLLVGPAGEPRRRIEVVGPPWRLTRNELLDDGEVQALTLYRDYAVDEESGVRFPHEVEARFPSEDTMLRFSIKSVTPNSDLERGIFDIQEKLRDSRLRRHLVSE